MAAANGARRVWVGTDGLLSTPSASAVIREREGGKARPARAGVRGRACVGAREWACVRRRACAWDLSFFKCACPLATSHFHCCTSSNSLSVNKAAALVCTCVFVASPSVSATSSLRLH
eukprot:4134301-Pleurochrysis_carterae.AAC.2